jgi:hypothetical protein
MATVEVRWLQAGRRCDCEDCAIGPRHDDGCHRNADISLKGNKQKNTTSGCWVRLNLPVQVVVKLETKALDTPTPWSRVARGGSGMTFAHD